ncbi:MAG TPA: adenylate/guanylate cyclase domain-containing protein [Gaiellaceae bacterium]|nr:adenylate/guanylate cyclase domain-containing protein [Gaiellaceae bacterium]
MQCPQCGWESPEGLSFCGNCGAALAVAPEPREVRKVVTVVFCDLTGSTVLGDTTDPETVRATMRSYYDAMRTILERHGGTVEKFIGDAVMAVFGVPVAREDDALRAVRAAWEMRAAIPALGLAARIGVNTGEVVAGEGDTLVTGDAVNVAARLEQAAEAGEVLVGVETRRLVRDAVRVEQVEVTAKGKVEPVQAFRLLDLDLEAEAIARRFETPLVGRAGELEQLRQAFDRAIREQRCHLFTLLGAAGVGKSRLVAEFLASVDASVLEGRCLDYGEGITYWPVVSILKQIGSAGENALRLVVAGGTLPNEVPWTVRSTLELVAAERPLIVVFDDVQWGEDTFLDLIDHIADLSRGAPILLLCIARPDLLEKRAGWGGGKLNATTILLEPLTADECSALITVHGDVGDDVRARILIAADGNPLFVEEMVALVQESGDVRIPSTVQALLQARIDQLAGDERAVVERGAVEGEVFHRGAVAELARPTEIDPHLVGLVRKELIRPTSPTLAGEQAYRFRHLLIRDAAYDALPKATRAELHERFAGWLAEHAENLIELDEVLGYHLEHAARYREELGDARDALAAQAGAHLAAAGRRAGERGDVPAALKLLGRALSLLGPGPAHESATLDRVSLLLRARLDSDLLASIDELDRSEDERLRMHGRLTRALHEIETVSDSSLGDALVLEAHDLFEKHGDDRGLAATALYRASRAWLRTNATDTAAAMDAFDAHAERAGVIDLSALGNILRIGPFVWGPFTIEEMRQRVAHLPPDAHPRIVIESQVAEREGRYDDALAGTDRMLGMLSELGLAPLRVAPLNARAGLLGRLGRLDEAVEAYEEVLALMRELGQTSYVSTSLIEYGELRYARGELDEAERLAVEGEELSDPEDRLNFSKGRRLRALVAADRVDDEAALSLAESALEHALRTDFPIEHGGAYEALGHVHHRAGRTTEARAAYEEAEAIWSRYDWSANARLVEQLLVEL